MKIESFSDWNPYPAMSQQKISFSWLAVTMEIDSNHFTTPGFVFREIFYGNTRSSFLLLLPTCIIKLRFITRSLNCWIKGFHFHWKFCNFSTFTVKLLEDYTESEKGYCGTFFYSRETRLWRLKNFWIICRFTKAKVHFVRLLFFDIYSNYKVYLSPRSHPNLVGFSVSTNLYFDCRRKVFTNL